MIKFFSWLLFLSVPVLMLLFVLFRLRLRVVYPHDLLLAKTRSKNAELLFRSLRLYFDIIIDALCAIVIASAIVGWPIAKPKGRAVVLDCSRSMLSGYRGDRPLDLACEDLLEKYKDGYKLYILGTEPHSLKPALMKANKQERYAAEHGPAALAMAIEDNRLFLQSEPELLKKLSRYKSITFLTDSFAQSASGLEVVQYGKREQSLLYPLRAYKEGPWYKRLWLSKSGAVPEILYRVEADLHLEVLPESDYSIEKVPEGFILGVKDFAVFVLSWHGASMPFSSAMLMPELKAEGALPEKAKGIIEPWLSSAFERSDKSILLSDKKPGKKSFMLSYVDIDPLVLDPINSLGRVVAGAYKKKANFSVGPAGLASGETAFGMVASLLQKAGTKKELSPSIARDNWLALGEGYVYPGKNGAEIIRAPASEYWPSDSDNSITIPPAGYNRLPALISLLFLLALKLGLSYAFRSGKIKLLRQKPS